MPERVVTACVLIIGNEILSGRTQDTNLNHIANVLGESGVRVREARVIPDTEDAIVDAVNEVRAKYDYVFTTGGIGPTHDDITADCIAKAFGVPSGDQRDHRGTHPGAAVAAGRHGIAHAHGADSPRCRTGRERHGRPAGIQHRQRLRDGRHSVGDAGDDLHDANSKAARSCSRAR